VNRSGATGPTSSDGVVTRGLIVRGGARADGTTVDLAVVELGEAAAPAIVLAHGVGSSARFVTVACAPPLVEAGWRVVTYDARGHGASTACRDAADHHLDAHADDLAAVVASAGDVAAVGGISLGGHAALRWRGSLPRVVCLPAWRGAARVGEGPHAGVAAEIRRDGVAGLLARLRADTDLPRWLQRTLVTDYARHDPASLEAALLALDGGRAPERDEVRSLDAALAVVAWRDDPGHPFEVAEALVEDAPSATLTELSIGALEDRLTRFGDAIVAALRSVGVRA
jgi:pimeloyl-ACP methyl ester carboxylesterase